MSAWWCFLASGCCRLFKKSPSRRRGSLLKSPGPREPRTSQIPFRKSSEQLHADSCKIRQPLFSYFRILGMRQGIKGTSAAVEIFLATEVPSQPTWPPVTRASGDSTGITCSLGLPEKKNCSMHDGSGAGVLIPISQAPRSLLRLWMLFTSHGAHGAYATSRRKCCGMLAMD